MSLAYIDSQTLFCIAIAAVLGAAIGWFLHRHFAGDGTGLEAEWREKFDRLTSEHRVAQSALKAEQTRVADVSTKLTGVESTLTQSRNLIFNLETELGTWKGRVPGLEADLAARDTALERARADHEAALEGARAEVQAFKVRTDAAAGEVRASKSTLLQTEAELAKLRREITIRSENEQTLGTRVIELQPLVARLRDVEARFAKENEQKNAEVARLTPLAAEVNGLRSRLAEVDGAGAKLAKAKEEEIATLNSKLRELDALRGQISDRDKQIAGWNNKFSQLAEQSDAKHKDAEARLVAAGGTKDSELTALRAELDHRAALLRDWQARFDNEAGGHVVALQSHVAQITVHTSDLKTKDAQIGQLTARLPQIDSLRAELAARDGKIKDDAARHAAALLAKDEEIGQLAIRIKEIAALQTQLAERDSKLAERDGRLKDGDTRHAGALKAKDDEIHQLNSRLREVEVLRGQVTERDAKLSGLENKLKEDAAGHSAALKMKDDELGQKHKTELKSKDEEISQIALRLKELDTLRAQLAEKDARMAERDNKLRDGETRHTTALKSKDDELGQLTVRLRELDTLRAQIAERDSKMKDGEGRYAAAIRAKDDEIVQLMIRLNEIEPLRAQISERDNKLKDWEFRHGSSLKSKDDEIGQYIIRLKEVETLKAQLNERDSRLKDSETRYANASKDWDTRYAAAVRSKDEEIGRLSLRLGDIDKLRAEVSQRDAQVRDWQMRYTLNSKELEGKYTTTVKTKEEQIGQLTVRLREVDSLKSELTERESALRDWNRKYTGVVQEWEAKHAAAIREKDAEITRLRGNVSKSETDLAAWDKRYAAVAAQVAQKDEALNNCGRRVSDLEAQLIKPKRVPGEIKDDLAQVYGVGPVLAKELNAYGVYLFEQIARWTETDINHFGSVLPHQFNDRIRREDWIGSAKTEHHKKYGDKL